ncbi:MAG: hypothetical protein DA328_08420 [Nitrososphaeraceae archaeon]|nr:hypothetical protein [Nitrososphaeraceae archaeon]
MKNGIFVLTSILFATIVSILSIGIFSENLVMAQTQNATTSSNQSSITQPTYSTSTMAVKITSPEANSVVPVGNLSISGISSDNAETNCQVYVDWNDLKPFQNVTATGANGENDFSTWSFKFDKSYHEIIEGINELTSKITCTDNSNTISKWNSLNVTGLQGQNNMVNNTFSANNTKSNKIILSESNMTDIENNNSTAINSVHLESEPTTTQISTNEYAVNLTNVNTLTEQNNSAVTNNVSETYVSSGQVDISMELEKDEVHQGDFQQLHIEVIDPLTQTEIPEANVKAFISSGTDFVKQLFGTTDEDGKSKISWKVGGDSNPGKYDVKVLISKDGYTNSSGDTNFTVYPKTSAMTQVIDDDKNAKISSTSTFGEPLKIEDFKTESELSKMTMDTKKKQEVTPATKKIPIDKAEPIVTPATKKIPIDKAEPIVTPATKKIPIDKAEPIVTPATKKIPIDKQPSTLTISGGEIENEQSSIPAFVDLETEPPVTSTIELGTKDSKMIIENEHPFKLTQTGDEQGIHSLESETKAQLKGPKAVATTVDGLPYEMPSLFG